MMVSDEVPGRVLGESRYRLRAFDRIFFLVLCFGSLSCNAAQTRESVDGQQMSSDASREIAVSGSGPISLSAEAVMVALQAPNGTQQTDLAAEVQSLKRNERLYLVLGDLAISEQPGVLYHIYLDLPAGAVPKHDDLHYIGALNFFSVIPGSAQGGRLQNLRSYDMTELVKELKRANLLTKSTTVTIIPAGTPSPSSHPVIGGIKLVKQ